MGAATAKSKPTRLAWYDHVHQSMCHAASVLQLQVPWQPTPAFSHVHVHWAVARCSPCIRLCRVAGSNCPGTKKQGSSRASSGCAGGGPLQSAWGVIRVEVAEGHLPYEAGSFTDRRRAVWSWLGHVVNMPLVLAPKLGRFGGRPRLTCAEKLLSDASAMVW